MSIVSLTFRAKCVDGGGKGESLPSLEYSQLIILCETKAVSYKLNCKVVYRRSRHDLKY